MAAHARRRHLFDLFAENRRCSARATRAHLSGWPARRADERRAQRAARSRRAIAENNGGDRRAAGPGGACCGDPCSSSTARKYACNWPATPCARRLQLTTPKARRSHVVESRTASAIPGEGLLFDPTSGSTASSAGLAATTPACCRYSKSRRGAVRARPGQGRVRDEDWRWASTCRRGAWSARRLVKFNGEAHRPHPGSTQLAGQAERPRASTPRPRRYPARIDPRQVASAA
ncbi:hypothetical protein ACFQX7_30200, partial [Luedemannella flava]